MLNNKVYSALNIVGLAAGMAVALLIALWVVNEYSYDKFLPDYKSLYQVELNFTDPHEGEHTQAAVSLPIADVLRKEYPEVCCRNRLDGLSRFVGWHKKALYERGCYWVRLFKNVSISFSERK